MKRLTASFYLVALCLVMGSKSLTFSVQGTDDNAINEIIKTHNLRGSVTFHNNFKTASISGYCNTQSCSETTCRSGRRYCTNKSGKVDSYLASWVVQLLSEI